MPGGLPTLGLAALIWLALFHVATTQFTFQSNKFKFRSQSDIAKVAELTPAEVNGQEQLDNDAFAVSEGI